MKDFNKHIIERMAVDPHFCRCILNELEDTLERENILKQALNEIADMPYKSGQRLQRYKNVAQNAIRDASEVDRRRDKSVSHLDNLQTMGGGSTTTVVRGDNNSDGD